MAPSAHISYDEIPYDSNPFPQSHPDRLAMLARLFSVNAPDVNTARVLELGCAAGGNLIPIAARFPGMKLLGVDLSPRQITDGKAIIETMGLKNITLLQADISALPDSIGEFDYIICHGVFSWVPTHVQDRILQICNKNLSKTGIAYISYNTYPGWHMSGAIRDMMIYHASRFQKPSDRVGQARALLDFLAQNAPAQNSNYGQMLKESVEILRKQPDTYLMHEYLEEYNQPLYFYEFNDRANKAGLKFMGESNFSEMLDSRFPADVQKTLRSVAPDIIHMEQYLDFLGRRTFRQTLLVHQDVPVNRNMGVPSIRNMSVLGLGRHRPISLTKDGQPVKDNSDIVATTLPPDVTTNKPEIFISPRSNITVTEPVVKAALIILQEAYPQTIWFDQLFDLALDRAGIKTSSEIVKANLMQTMGVGLLQCFTYNQVNFHTVPTGATLKPAEKPVAYAMARYQAEKGNRLTNLFHENVAVSELDRQMVRMLDGTRGPLEILDRLVELHKLGILVVKDNDIPVTNTDHLRRIFGTQIRPSIERLAKASVIVG